MKVRFLVGFLAVYLALMWPWSGWHHAHRDAFVAVANRVVAQPASAGPPCVLCESTGWRVTENGRIPCAPRFHRRILQPVDDRGKSVDTVLQVKVEVQGVPQWLEIGISSRQVGYLPTAVLLALIVATPIALTRRLRSLGLGIVLIHLFIALRIAVMLFWGSHKDWTPPTPGASVFWSKAIEAAVMFFGVGQPMGYIAPVVLWVLVSFRREDVASLLGAPAGDDSPDDGPPATQGDASSA